MGTYTLGPAFAEQAHHRQLELKTKDASLSDPTNDGQSNKTMTDTSPPPRTSTKAS
ncbi:hypothetical protein VD0002_g5857 [Verticillium dahliae]|uniref:Uncharacterized protein n=1 Tax=Verticillium dahliae TaxID=27337 RepID=A0A2J8EKS1_VERDA|nr:hypothetical protein BJF96_g6247 [Verticillium dahliae]PNH39603.1 hypothetical protein VD0004_g7303 [Verticillium dahliae]PNH54196.1 hypothetical protein VD0003_g3271 [Verticillium dahliae]PNH62093.1 hypothetical protein VD0002_g5857 [Verticillium dahliae]PNH71806.1 hypothetical protein VD0001_g5732 [Verticillium dahliae]